MGIIDIKELERKSQLKQEDTSAILTKSIDGKTYFKGKFLADWYDSYDECQKANQDWYRVKTNKDVGLNEHGQTADQVAKMAKKREMDKEIAEIREKLSKMEAEKQSFDAQEPTPAKKKGK